MKVLLSGWGSIGEHLGVAELCRRLMRHGFDVHVLASEVHRGLYPVTEEQFVPLRSVRLSDYQEVRFNRSGEIVRHIIDTIAEEQYNVALSAIDGREIDLVLSTWITPGVITAAQTAGRRVVPLHLYPLSVMAEDDLPVFTRWPRLTASMGYPRHASDLRRRIIAFYRSMSPRLLALRARNGLEDDGAFMPGIGGPGLALFPRQLMRTETGHVYLNMTPLSAVPDPLPLNISRFLDQGSPPWLIFLGSLADIGVSFYRKIATQLEGLGRRSIIVYGQPEAPTSCSTMVLELGRFPIAALMQHVEAVVHHAGINSVVATLLAGKSAITIPRGGDQLDNAYRLRDLGAGLPLRMQGDQFLSLQALVRTLKDSTAEDNARRLSRVLTNEFSPRIPPEAIRLLSGTTDFNL